MKVKLRNGIIAETKGEFFPEVISTFIPADYRDKDGDNWILGEVNCLCFSDDDKGSTHPSTRIGGAWGPEYDVVEVLEREAEGE